MKWVYVLLVLILVSSVFAYTGCPGSSPIKVTAQADDEYQLSFVNRDNVQYKVPFAQITGGSLRYGRDNRDFITQEVSGFDALLAGPTPEDAFNINRRDTFLVTGGGLVGSSHVLEYESIDLANKVLAFEDLALGPKMVNFMPAQDKDPNLVLGQFDLVVGGSSFRGFISAAPSNSLSIDLDGNGALNGDTAQIIIRGGGILDIGSNDGGAAGNILVTLTTPSRNFRDSKGDESLEFTVSTENGQVSLGGVQYYRNGVLRTSKSIPSFDLYQDGHSNNWYGATDYGVLIEYFRPSSSSEELMMDYPGLGPCAVQLSQPVQASQEQAPAVLASPCQDFDGFDPFTKGMIMGVDSTSKVHSVPDICQENPSDVVVEGLCNNGKPDLVRFRCLGGCKEGACIPRGNLFDGATWFCLGDAEEHSAMGCHSEKALFGEARDFCTKNCNGVNCRIKSLELGAVCESLPQLIEKPKEKQVEQPVESQAESSVNPAPEPISEVKEPPKSFFGRVWNWFASIFS